MSEKPAWWQQEIRRLEGSLRGHLHRSLPALRQDHDDLVNDTLEGLAKHIERSPTVPDSWFGSVAPPEEHRLGFYRLAHTILNRRTTDLLRKRIPVLTAPKLIAELLTENESESIDRRMHMIRLFQLCMELVGKLTADERRLIHETATGPTTPLSPKDRQRLKRVRAKLAKGIENRLGQSITNLLRT